MRPAPVDSRHLLLALAVLFATPAMARAQQDIPGTACVSATGPDSGEVPASRPSGPRTTDSGATTLRIIASMSADEVRFARTPRICVRLTGDARLDSVHVAARRNLPSPVVSGTTYRNVYVAVEIIGRLNAECIAARITGAPADSTRAARCASLDARTGAGSAP